MALATELEQLRALARASRLLAASRDLDELLDNILAAAREAVGAERGTVFVCEPGKREIFSRVVQTGGDGRLEIRLPYGQGIAGHIAQDGGEVRVDDARLCEWFDPETDKRTGFTTHAVCAIPLRTPDGQTAGVLQLLNKPGGFTDADCEFLKLMGGIAAQALANARASELETERKRMAREMQLAAEIQQALLPRDLPRRPGLMLSARNRSSAAVGGDYYDAIPLEDGRLLLCLADVSGKGIPAALVMSNVQAALQAAAGFEFHLAKFCARLSDMLHARLQGRRYLTGVFLVLDADLRRGELVNAGHPAPLARGPAGVRRLPGKGVPIGLMANAAPKPVAVEFSAGETVALYSDGLTDAPGPDGEPLGVPGLEAVLATLPADCGPDEMLAALFKAAEAAPDDDRDDQTALVFSLR